MLSMREREHRRKLRTEQSKRRRDELRRKNLCINGAKHGKVTKRGRCAWCNAVDDYGLSTVLKREAAGLAPPRPRGYEPRPRRNAEQLEMDNHVREDQDDDDDPDLHDHQVLRRLPILRGRSADQRPLRSA